MRHRRRLTAQLNLETLETREVPSNIPLPDLSLWDYYGYQAGLYPNGTNTRPPQHEEDGIRIAQNRIVPRNIAGQPDPANGRIVMISVGMSNTTQEFGTGSPFSFKYRADRDPSKDRQLVIVDGAQGGQAADAWVNPQAQTWNVVNQRLNQAGVTPAQVQVAWIKQADRQPALYGAFPAHAQHLQDELFAIVRNLKMRYPNIQIAYLSSRTMSYNNQPSGLNPEPYAYESGFSVKWLIEQQLNGDPRLNYNPQLGQVMAPYLSWGPYLWADGTNYRSDLFVWERTDLRDDATHPSPSGVRKVADQLLAFFKTDVTATPWFLREDVVGQPPTAWAWSDVTAGTAPLGVQFIGYAEDPDGTIDEYNWTFEDGTFSSEQYPYKLFYTPGTYHARLTVRDNAGNTAMQTVTISVAATGPTAPGENGRDYTAVLELARLHGLPNASAFAISTRSVSAPGAVSEAEPTKTVLVQPLRIGDTSSVIGVLVRAERSDRLFAEIGSDFMVG